MAKQFEGQQALMLERSVARIDRIIGDLDLLELKVYNEICHFFHNNTSFKDAQGKTDSDLAYAAFEEYTTRTNDDGSKMTAEQIGQLLILLKASINARRPGTVIDDVPAIEIDGAMPVRLKLDRVIVPEVLTKSPDVIRMEHEKRKQNQDDQGGGGGNDQGGNNQQ